MVPTKITTVPIAPMIVTVTVKDVKPVSAATVAVRKCIKVLRSGARPPR